MNTTSTITARTSSGWNVGDEGILVRVASERGEISWLLREVGWAGNTNGIGVTAQGWHRVVRVVGWADDEINFDQIVEVVPSAEAP